MDDAGGCTGGSVFGTGNDMVGVCTNEVGTCVALVSVPNLVSISTFNSLFFGNQSAVNVVVNVGCANVGMVGIIG